MATTGLPTPTAPMTDSTSMLANLPADFMSGAGDIPEPQPEGVDDTPAPDAPVVDDEPIAEEPVVDEPIVDDEPVEPEPSTEPAAEPTEPPAGEEELPEGTIKTKGQNGKYKYSLDENRYRTVYDGYKLTQQAAELIGEPLTTEALSLRHEAYLKNERLWNNLTSADPTAQTDVVNAMISEMRNAQATGEVGDDPTIPFAQTVYTKLKADAPDAFAALRLQAARDLLAEMYDLGARTGDLQVGHSAQHIARALAGIGPKPADMPVEQYMQQIRDVTGRSQIPFYTSEEFQGLARGEDPSAALARENAELKAQLNRGNQPVAAEQFDTWNRGHIQDVNKAVFDNAVKPALASVEGAWKQFPDAYNDLVVDRLNRLVSKDVREDAGLMERVAEMKALAKRATSEQRRQAIGQDIRQLMVNRANIAAAKHKPAVLKFAAEALKGQSAQSHARRSSAQTRTAPQGQSTPVRQSAVPTPVAFKNGTYDSATAMKQALAALSGR